MRKIILSFCSVLIQASALAASDYAPSAIDYVQVDLPFLQAHSSQPIAINDDGQVLCSYRLAGPHDNKLFVVFGLNGGSHDITLRHDDRMVQWAFLTPAGDVYGSAISRSGGTALYRWSLEEGSMQLAVLPEGARVHAANDEGQVLVNCPVLDPDGGMNNRVFLWEDGRLRALTSVQGELGIVSSIAYANGMNSHGDVVGRSHYMMVHKNTQYAHEHATLWSAGDAVDLHVASHKLPRSEARAINDRGDVIVYVVGQGQHLRTTSGEIIEIHQHACRLNNHYAYDQNTVWSLEGEKVLSLGPYNRALTEDSESIWQRVTKIVGVTNQGLVLAEGVTIYGEQHALVLSADQDFPIGDLQDSEGDGGEVAQNDRDRELADLVANWPQDIEIYLSDDPHVTDDSDSVMAAINYQDVQELRALYSRGRNFDVRLTQYTNRQGYSIPGYDMTLVHYAAKIGRVHSLATLLSLGLDPNDQQMYGNQTALFLAVGVSVNAKSDADRAKALEMARILIEYGADVNAVDYKGMTALMYACNGPNHFELVRSLLEAGADPQMVMQGGQCAMDFAKRKHPRGNAADRQAIIDCLTSRA